MSDRAAEYRARLDELKRGGGKRWRAPTGLRDEIIVWARKRRAEGLVVGSIASAIGLSETTLSKWLSPGGGPGELRPVRVTADVAIGGRLVVVTPEGYRLEGVPSASVLGAGGAGWVGSWAEGVAHGRTAG